MTASDAVHPAPIVDNVAQHRYELVVDGHLAVIVYEREPGTIRFTHTLVPAAIGGRGIGSRLAAHALDAARARGDEVIPQCAFIAAYIDKHPGYRDLVA